MNLPLDQFSKILGDKSVIRNASEMDAYMKEWRGRVVGKSPCVLLPQTTEQVSAIVKICAAQKIALVPQGGNNGLVGAGVPTTDNSMITLSLKRMNKIRVLDADDFSMIAEAGCILTVAKEAAALQSRLLAMTLASEGSASIGGLIATNAGGSYTLRYGNMREQVLGLEAVMADGSVVSELRSLRKNNSGYDLKQLLIGSEGTLGIITAARLKLLPKPNLVEAALVALPDVKSAITALGVLREATADRLSAFELMPRLAIDSAVRFLNKREPFDKTYPWYALVETHDSGGSGTLEKALEILFGKNLALDATVAQNQAQHRAFWNLREGIVEAQKSLGASLKHDLAAPVGRIAELIEKGSAVVEKTIPGTRIYAFGHAGDGNIHFNLSPPEGMSKEAFLAKREEMAARLNDLVLALGGSISAEHGIGRFYRDEFLRTGDPLQIALMRKIKAAFDPQNILNPGVLL
ncbi:MAG: FAD-binding oxidoreductase [Proteobacteria bacterium]|nr:FAD-binding oxidoreductase [Pseudomonadota bacterium]